MTWRGSADVMTAPSQNSGKWWSPKIKNPENIRHAETSMKNMTMMNMLFVAIITPPICIWPSCVTLSSVYRVRLLNPAHENQYEQDQDDEAQPAAWRIPPASAMWPCGQCTQEKQDKYDQ
jgi:hypothetical protein